MIVIDTHILVWINLNPNKIPKSILNAINGEKRLGVAVRSAILKMQGDPADRLISATALEYNCKLATIDGELLALDWLATIQ